MATDLETFVKEVNEKGIYFFKNNSLNFELSFYPWSDILYFCNFKKYDIHTLLKEYKHDELFDYSLLLDEEYVEDNGDAYEKYPEYVKQFAYRVTKIFDNTESSAPIHNKIDKETEQIIQDDKYELLRDNYDEFLRIFAKLGVTNLPDKTKIKELCYELFNIDNEEEVKGIYERANELAGEYSDGENEDFDKFFFMITKMKNISASSYYYENSDNTVDTGKTVSFNDKYYFSALFKGYREASPEIKLKTPKKIKTYTSATKDYISHVKEIMDLFGFDHKDVKMFNKYMIYLFCANCSDELWYDNIYSSFEI